MQRHSVSRAIARGDIIVELLSHDYFAVKYLGTVRGSRLISPSLSAGPPHGEIMCCSDGSFLFRGYQLQSIWSQIPFQVAGVRGKVLYINPAAPSVLLATAVSTSQIDLTWTDNSSGESGFKIEKKTGSGGTYSQIATVVPNVISYSDTGLSEATTYYYRVRACNAIGNSDYSNAVNSITPAPPPTAAEIFALSKRQAMRYSRSCTLALVSSCHL